MSLANTLGYPSKTKLWLIALLSLVFSFVAFGVGNTPQAASIAQGYITSDSELIVGMGASLSQDSSSNKTSVERSSVANKGKFVGIVTTKDASLVTLSTQTSNLYVATQGQAATYVTDINGAIHKGDYVAVSPLKGVLMKASGTESTVVGSALADFDTGGANSQEVTKGDGSKQMVKVGLVQIDVNPRTINSGEAATQEKSFLQQLGQSLAGKSISDWQVVTVLVIFLLLLVVEGSLMYGAIHSAIISIGRNPLSRSGVYKQLLQVLVTAVAVLSIGMVVIFGVLKV